MDRVYHQYRLIEKGYDAIRPKNSLFQTGVREVTPKIPREQEKDNVDLCKLSPDEVALKDLARIEALARTKSRFITKEMIEKNVLKPETAADDGVDQERKVSDYDLWVVKKDFESKIRSEMLEQLLKDYDEIRQVESAALA